MIRVTNSTIFDRISSQLVAQQSRLAITQEKISSGKNYLRPSDGPDAVAALDRLESTVNQSEQYLKNLGRVKDKLNFQETAIVSLNDELIRCKELVLQGANGTLGSELRATLAIELKSIYDSAIAIGNQKDLDGSYLFSGYKQGTPPFSSSLDPLVFGFDGMYAGDDESQRINIDQGYGIEIGMPGSALFSSFKDSDGNKTDIFSLLKSAINGLENNDQDAIQKSIDDVNLSLTHVNIKLAQVGSKMNVVENQVNVLEDRTTTLEMAISSIHDLDYVKAVTDLKNQSIALEAGQASFAQIANLTLFNYIK